jgi:O-antigen ligase
VNSIAESQPSVSHHWPRAYELCERITEKLIFGMIIFSPWAFASVHSWAIWIMNAAGYALAGLAIAKKIIAGRHHFRPGRWDQEDAAEVSHGRTGIILIRSLIALTIIILGYCLIAALNARAVYSPDNWQFDYRECIEWLPHSYDRNQSWFAFFTYLALACSFWSIRDWLLGKTAREQKNPESGRWLTTRLRKLLWVLALNGAVIAIEGIIQRIDGTPKVLWIFLPEMHPHSESQFGPFAYRSNAAQYFNMLWPVCLGFWWVVRKRARHLQMKGAKMGSTPHTVVLPCALLIAFGSLISTSRAAFAVVTVLFIGSAICFAIADRRRSLKHRIAFIVLLLAVFGFGLFLAWPKLAPRLQATMQSKLGVREKIYEISNKMARDFFWMGSGPWSFEALYQLYRQDPNEVWRGHAYNDWLETVSTFGIIGTALILSALAVALIKRFFAGGGGISTPWLFYILAALALSGCLAHAIVDFPLQVHSVLFLFLVICCILFSTTRPKRSA